jgi:hypothetical protein
MCGEFFSLILRVREEPPKAECGQPNHTPEDNAANNFQHGFPQEYQEVLRSLHYCFHHPNYIELKNIDLHYPALYRAG